MKKYLFIIFMFLIVIIIIKYFSMDYTLNYNIDNHEIKIINKNKRNYIEIDNKYNFDIYDNKKLKIKNIELIEDNNLICIVPKIKNIKSFPLCYQDEKYTDFMLIDNKILSKYKSKEQESANINFSYNYNLNNKEHILLWNYKGFYKMNGDEFYSIDLFEEGKYDNSLMYLVNDKLLIPNYEQDHMFKSFYLLNIINGKSKIIESKYEISYDSYIVGNIKNKVYLYDNKNFNLYEINIKIKKVKLVGSEELGYFKYVDGKKVLSKKSEYKNKAINYNKKVFSNYEYIIENNSLFKIINDNKEIKKLIFLGQNIKIISEYKDILYFISEDAFYKYDDKEGSIKIFNYFELKFNNNNIIYIFNR